MSAVLQSGAAAFLSRFEGLHERLPGDRQIRRAAAEAFRLSGLPSVRDEAWKYTSLRPVAEESFHESLTQLSRPTWLLSRAPSLDAPCAVFVGGRFRDDLSTLPDGFEVLSFAQNTDFGRLPRPEQEPLVALNTMLAEDGLVVRLPDGVDGGTLVVLSLGSDVHGRPIAFHPRHSIRLRPGARLTLIEVGIGEGAYLHNPVSEIIVAEGAALTHIRLQDESADAFYLATLYAEIATNAVYDSFTLNLGARVARTEMRARLIGPRASVHLNGAQLLGGVQHGDITTVVSHDAPNCASRQTIKNVLDGRARGVFQGRIEVARVAQKTDGYQMNQALLLSPDAEIDSKPQLEIYADDVKCSHGATVGELDADQLFYARSRGVPEAKARAMLVRAFLTEAFDGVTHEGARAMLENAVDQWWMRRAA